MLEPRWPAGQRGVRPDQWFSILGGLKKKLNLTSPVPVDSHLVWKLFCFVFLIPHRGTQVLSQG